MSLVVNAVDSIQKVIAGDRLDQAITRAGPHQPAHEIQIGPVDQYDNGGVRRRGGDAFDDRDGVQTDDGAVEENNLGA